MKKSIFIGLPLALILTSCATIFSGSTAKVSVATSTGEPAHVNVDGRDFYVDGLSRIKVNRGFKSSTIVAENDKSQGSIVVKKKFNSTTLLNLLLGGIGILPGAAIDGVTGAITKPASDFYYINMRPKPIQEVESMQKDPEGRVSRNAAGKTDLEKTIIRWYFDSEPRGARVFWRVVSSVPAEVKNTNELYLGTTPYEDTRSFNILGLTYENSRDVQIEIKMVRSGYMDQIKRFNVRQAIDQQEISSFFDLVKN